MTLYEYVSKQGRGAEITVLDTDYDVEVYFYNDEVDDLWSQSMQDLSKVLRVVEERHLCAVVVDFSGLIKRKLPVLQKAELFTNCTVDVIMSNLHATISGYVSEEWFARFVSVLTDDTIKSFD